MKKNLLKSLVIFLLLPVLIFVGCKDSKSLPKISVSRYFKDKITVSRHSFAETSTDTISLLTQKKAKKQNLSPYTKFEISAQPIWIYKMYVEKISFYVYCNQTTETPLTLNLKMTDLASEKDIWASTEENVPVSDYEEQCTVEPKAFKSIKCTFEIGKTVVMATGSTITINVDSLEIFSLDENGESTFRWLIYDFEVHGESRAYTR